MRLPSLALLACLLASPAAAQDTAQHHQMSGFHGAMAAMQEQMGKVPTSGDPDVDFATMMIPHHQGAIDMAKAELAQGKDPELRELAKEVIAAQEREITFLRQWLQTRGK